MLLLLLASAVASPHRPLLEKPVRVLWHPGLTEERVIIKLHDDVDGIPQFDGVGALPVVAWGHPMRAEFEALAQEHDLARVTQYFVLESPSGQGSSIAQAFNEMDWVELAYLASVPIPPPGDLAPTTPDFRGEQLWLDPAPGGVGHDEAVHWPGGTGSEVAVADLEYSWDPDHEDLDTAGDILAWGWDSGEYRFHGTAVLGQLFAQDNGYGVEGLVPDAEPVVVSPFFGPEQYSVAQAILGAVEILGPGDVLLIEQQAWYLNNYAPVEVEPLVFDAISTAVAAGIVVVEPTGNGFQDLDGPGFEGLFDREVRDSGAILVGGGAPSFDELPRSWVPGASSYGERVDVQGWVSSIVTTINGEYGGNYADLFFPATQAHPEGDPRQAYTTQFGGTSGASAMVAGVAAAAQSVALVLHGEALAPEDLRALMVATGSPQPETDPNRIGPLPDLRRLLRYGLLP
jgi:hypothetical protein